MTPGSIGSTKIYLLLTGELSTKLLAFKGVLNAYLVSCAATYNLEVGVLFLFNTTV